MYKYNLFMFIIDNNFIIRILINKKNKNMCIQNKN